jgi:hypothetical protein
MVPHRTSATRNFLKINGLICVCLEFRTLGSPSAVPVSYRRSSCISATDRNQSHAGFRGPARPARRAAGSRSSPSSRRQPWQLGCGRPPAASVGSHVRRYFPRWNIYVAIALIAAGIARSLPALSRGRLCSAICRTRVERKPAATLGRLAFLSLSCDHCDPHGMIGTELMELNGEPLMIFELTAR